MKTKEELNALKEEVKTLNRKLHELTEEELAQVSGGGQVPPVELVYEPGGDERLPSKQRVNETAVDEDVDRSYVPFGAPIAETAEGIRRRK